MRKLGVLGLALLAVFALGAVVAASASAASGPVWIVLLLNPEILHELAAGEKESILSSGGLFTLDAATATIDCTSEQDSGEIIGGNPGTDLSTIEFLKCSVEGLSTCLAGNVTAEDILVEVKTMLVYPHLKAGELGEAYDAFFPDNNETTNNLFVEFKLTGGVTACGVLLNNLPVDVNATGELVTDPAINKKCGVLALVGKLDSTELFVKTASGEEAVLGALESNGVTEAEYWMPTERAFLLLECLLEAFEGTAEELGTTDVDLVSGDEFGWEDGP